jgi:hypothetical protein
MHTLKNGKYRMTTYWTTPATITQYAQPDAEEVHVSWNIVSNRNPITTSAPLTHIARQPRNDLTMKTYFLSCTGYNFENLPETVTGINCRVTMNRGGRIADETIQLTYQGILIGSNQGKPAFNPQNHASTLSPVTVYGGDIALWEIKDGIDPSVVQDPSFGIVLRFRSHPAWPHKTTPQINAVEIQIY